MSNERESKRAIDAQFFEITKELHDLDHSLPSAGSRPRDWTPVPSPDEAFDPADLPPAPASIPRPLYAQIVLGFAVGLTIALILLIFHIIPAPSWLVGLCGIGALLCIAAAILLYLPKHRDYDDDGARV